MIEGVIIKRLDRFPDERGTVSHMLKYTDKEFIKFGEIYFSSVHPNAIKAWHLHKKMILNYVCISGNIKLVLCDDRSDSPTYRKIQEIFIGEDDYCLVQIPNGVYNGFKAVGDRTAIVANCSTLPYDPKEITRLPFNTGHIDYNWEIKNG